ncbi:MAG: lysophospholipid acyltransferase family protein [Desulfomonilaceae bacterium]|nr:lysophospholipid acyltransferase family protein [Desulfomonilaceae bacterium]
MDVDTHKKPRSSRLWLRVALVLLPKIVRAYFRIVDLTSRKIFLQQETEEQICKTRSFSIAGFHGALLWPSFYFRKYGGVIMVSRSSDGEIMDRCLRGFGYQTSRGSSSNFGKEALADMIQRAKTGNCNTGMAVDAPRGPARKAKIGSVIIAKETGQPIVPVGSWTSRHVQFNSWDQMILPLPFGTLVLVFGKPVEVPDGLSQDDYERIRHEMECSILAAQELAEMRVKQIKSDTVDLALEAIPTRPR